MHIERGCGISLLVISLNIGQDDWMGTMEVMELKTAIGVLEARVEEIRDWL